MTNQAPNKVLLVEDNLEFNQQLSSFLSQEWTVVRANNGQEGLDRFVENSDIVAVITDLEMPVMNGIDMIRRILELDHSHGVMIVVLSSYFNESSVKSLKELGVNLRFVKPIIPERLNQALKIALPSSRARVHHSSSDQNEPKPKKVLVVDDSLLILSQFRSYFEEYSEYDVVVANGGQEGEACFDNDKEIEIIFSDIEMGEISGIQFVRRIRSKPRGLDIPIVLMSTYLNPELKKEGEDLGILAYLTKPINFEGLERLLKRLEELSHLQKHEGKRHSSIGDSLRTFLDLSHPSNEEKERFRSLLIKFIEQSAARRDELLQEIIEREKIQNRLIESNLETQDLFEQKNKLVRILCHDLNNSIAIIKNSAISSMEKADEVRNKKNWQRVRKAVETQEEMVNHVITLEAISSGKSVMKLEPVSILEMVEDARFIFEDKLNKKNITLTVSLQKLEKCYVNADKVSLRNQVINNILSNAIKFSEADSEINISAKKFGSDKVVLSIRDQGIGIPEDIQKNLFSFTEYTSRTGTMGEKGTGFGMPLVKSFMDLYGGTIEIESREKVKGEEAHGTTFHLYFQEASVKKSLDSAS